MEFGTRGGGCMSVAGSVRRLHARERSRQPLPLQWHTWGYNTESPCFQRQHVLRTGGRGVSHWPGPLVSITYTLAVTMNGGGRKSKITQLVYRPRGADQRIYVLGRTAAMPRRPTLKPQSRSCRLDVMRFPSSWHRALLEMVETCSSPQAAGDAEKG